MPETPEGIENPAPPPQSEKVDKSIKTDTSPLDTPLRPQRMVDLQGKINHGEEVSDDERAELTGLQAFPNNPRGAELRKKQVLREKGLGEELTSDEDTELRGLFAAKFTSTESSHTPRSSHLRLKDFAGLNDERSPVVIPEGQTNSERRILSLIAKVDPSDRDVLYGDVKRLARNLEHPEIAKRDWLIDVYKKKGWIDDTRADELRGEDASTALTSLEDICRERASLRTTDQPFSKELPTAGSELGDFVRDELQARGIDPETCKVRYVEDVTYLPLAESTGNDRGSSRIDDYYHHGGYDGEELAMIRSGVTDARDTVYLSNLARWNNASQRPNFAVLVYAADAIEGIGPTGYMKSNGFHAFQFGGDIKRRSLLGVFKR